MTKRADFYSRAQFAILFLTVVGAPFAAESTTFARLTISQMSRTANAIVRARCVANTVAEVSGEIWTLTTFDVQETWRGAVPARITVRLLGGTVRNITSHVAGIPRFRPGEEVILFLSRTNFNDFSVVSWQQGTFRIRRDRGTGEELASQDGGAYFIFDPSSRRFIANGGGRLPVASFHSRVTSALEGAH